MAGTGPIYRSPDCWQEFDLIYAAIVLFTTMLCQWFLAFVLLILAWSDARKVEELLPFYSEFYAGVSSNCASGQNLYNLKINFPHSLYDVRLLSFLGAQIHFCCDPCNK